MKTGNAGRTASNAISVMSMTAALLVFGGSAALAQTSQSPAPPENYTTDGNSVDVIRGTFNLSKTDVAIGPQGGGMSYERTIAGDAYRSNIDGTIEYEPTSEFTWTYTVSVGAQSFIFNNLGGQTFTNMGADGASLDYNGSSTYTFTDAAGAVRTFDAQLASLAPGAVPPAGGPGGRIVQLIKPDGERWNWFYKAATYGSPSLSTFRVQSVTSTRGYQIKFEYEWNTQPTTAEELRQFGRITHARAINNSIDYCDPQADTCTALSQTWPLARYQWTDLTAPVWRLDVTDALDQTTGYVFSDRGLTEVDWPTPGRASTTLTYDFLGRVSQYTSGDGVWTYDYVLSDNIQVTTVTDPLSNDTVYRARLRSGPVGQEVEFQRLLYFVDPLGNRTDTTYDGNGRLTEVAFPEGNILRFARDDRGNITETRRIAKPSAPAADIVFTSVYPTTCANRITCNRPTSSTDGRGATTDYTYDSAHGGVLTETPPAPVVGGVRPQTRFSYQSLRAWYRTSASTVLAASPQPIWVQSGTSACTVSAASPGCAGLAEEVKSTTGYQAGSASTPSNLLPLTVSTGSGDVALTATVTTVWETTGDARTVDGPLAGVADTTRYIYNAIRQPVGVISPDPDGAGVLPYPATRTTYNADGQVTAVETGTTTAQTDAAWSAFASLARTATAYDAVGRKTRDTETIGAGTVSVVQYAYDAANRPTCTAVRMNPAVYGALPTSACSLSTTGANGPDRISHNTYDDAGRLLITQNAYRTTLAQATMTQAWTANSQVDWIEDANGNRSDYTYDGFDRRLKLEFPSTTLGAHAANPADYEQYGYDANGNVISRRVRDGQIFAYAYDALNRETVKTVPGLSTANDVFSTYDLLNRRLSGRFANATTGAGPVWTYDALSRVLTETAYGRTLAYQYDLAGNRTRLTWPAAAGGYLQYTYDLLNRMDEVRENGATTGAGLLANYAYDNLGRRKSLTRGNTAVTTWSYVANSRDWSLTQNLASTTNDLTLSFTLNPAQQALTRTASNGIYTYAPPALNQAYIRDGLNRYTSVDGTAFAYDARKNLTDDGPRTYAYDVENRLTTVSGSSAMTLAYDPLGRLRQTVSGSTTTDFLYDGDRLVAEYDAAGTLLARYAHGAGVDEPLVWYEGAALTDRRWLHADNQGSIIAVSGSGAGIIGSPYRYGPYGEPDTTNAWGGSRFRYTGQISLRHAPLWHYKARAYHPAIGRFLQTDPVGYEDGWNLYAYVANDPVNLTDPTGMIAEEEEDEEEATKVEEIFVRVQRRPRGERGGNRTIRDDLYASYQRQIREIDPNYSTLRDPTRSVTQAEVNALRRDLARLQSGRRSFGTEAEAAAAAALRGWVRTSERAHGAAIYRDPSSGRYYSRDVDTHNGGAWKVANSPSELQQNRRTSTLDQNLSRIGD